MLDLLLSDVYFDWVGSSSRTSFRIKISTEPRALDYIQTVKDAACLVLTNQINHLGASKPRPYEFFPSPMAECQAPRGPDLRRHWAQSSRAGSSRDRAHTGHFEYLGARRPRPYGIACAAISSSLPFSSRLFSWPGVWRRLSGASWRQPCGHRSQ